MPEDIKPHSSEKDFSFFAENINDSMEESISLLRQKLDNLYEDAPFGTITTTEDGICRSINQTCLSWIAISADEVINHTAFQKWVTADSWLSLQSEILKSRTAQPDEIKIRILSKNGDIHPVALSWAILFDADSETYIRRWIFIEDRKYTNYLGLSSIDSIFFNAHLGICVLDFNGKILVSNNAMEELTGYSRSELGRYISKSIQTSEFIKNLSEKIQYSLLNHGFWEGECRGVRHDGKIFIGWLNITRIGDRFHDAGRIVVCLYDITANAITQEQNLSLARIDTLTNLANRRAYYERFSRERSVSKRSKLFGAILYIDLDNFKSINDTKGHMCGDKLLVEVAKRLGRSVRLDDLVVRMGGDEFVIILTDLNSDILRAAFQARKIGDVILEAMACPWIVDTYEFICTASIGVAMFGQDETPDDLLKHADLAMYNAKKYGRNRLCFYDDAMQSATLNEVLMDQDLRRAIIYDQFELFFQPQTNADRQIISAEALLRWRHPTHGLLIAERFIPLAEENGLILPIGKWVLTNACKTLKLWEDNPKTRGLRLAVNISGRQFSENGFDQFVADLINEVQIDPTLLILELTESVVHDLEKTLQKMLNIQALGVRFSLDDFGTGYSSLAVLIELPISQLKIDKQFVKSLIDNKSAFVVTETIIAMAHTLAIEVIAEGVENIQQLKKLKSMGCLYYQGFLFGEPLEFKPFEEHLLKTISN
jgi:diguanylate cyclase (GGDEF)-like protein/PAS domain S-box-containing protein